MGGLNPGGVPNPGGPEPRRQQHRYAPTFPDTPSLASSLLFPSFLYGTPRGTCNRHVSVRDVPNTCLGEHMLDVAAVPQRKRDGQGLRDGLMQILVGQAGSPRDSKPAAAMGRSGAPRNTIHVPQPREQAAVDRAGGVPTLRGDLGG